MYMAWIQMMEKCVQRMIVLNSRQIKSLSEKILPLNYTRLQLLAVCVKFAYTGSYVTTSV